MFSFFKKIISLLFGHSSLRVIKSLQPIVEKINVRYRALASDTNEQLRERAVQLKQKIKADLAPLRREREESARRVKESVKLSTKLDYMDREEKLEKEYKKELQEVLNRYLPEAFAILKETARRFKENETLVLAATAYDGMLAKKEPFVEVKDGQATWHTTWEVDGKRVKWDMVHYDVQLLGGIVLHQGKIAEMATGEGKTLVSTLPIFLNALAGEGVHVITVNEYLAKRDAQWNGPIFQFHGLTIDCINNHPSYSPGRRAAYLSDVTYGTNNDFGFDYLRDNMARSKEERVQRKYSYAIIDEIDSILIDDARTPLILSGPSPHDYSAVYRELKPRIQQLYLAQTKLVTQFLEEAKKKIVQGEQENNEKLVQEGSLALFRVYRALPKDQRLIQLLGESGMRQKLAKTEDYFMEENSVRMPEADEPLFFTIDQRTDAINFTDKGIDLLSKAGGDDFFILPDMSTSLERIDQDSALTDEEKREEKEDFIQKYREKSIRIHVSKVLLKAYALYRKNIEYVVLDQRVKIVDQKRGRIMQGRRFSNGLHEGLEAKENVSIQKPTQTNATITLQNYFRLYDKLAGMTGTAESEAVEFWEVYKIPVVVMPTHRPIARKDLHNRMFRTKKEKYDAIAKEVQKHTLAGRPVLLGTSSVESSEEIQKVLKIPKKHVLNAKNHARESQIISEAGTSGRVTVATNMAGRGTDIKLTHESREAGGLVVIGSEPHENERIDRQLRGRSGRQGDPGETRFYISLEDELIAHMQHSLIGKHIDKMLKKEGYGKSIEDASFTNLVKQMQQHKAYQSFSQRKRALEYDDVMDCHRKVIYKKRDQALSSDQLELLVMQTIYDALASLVQSSRLLEEATGSRGFESCVLSFKEMTGMEFPYTKKEFMQFDLKALKRGLYQQVKKRYESYAHTKYKKIADMASSFKGARQKAEQFVLPWHYKETRFAVHLYFDQLIEQEGRNLQSLIESTILLETIDEAWTDHLSHMEDLKEAVRNAAYAQKDPILQYKEESLNIFKLLIDKINQHAVTLFFHAEPFTSIDLKEYDPSLSERHSQIVSSRSLEESSTKKNTPITHGNSIGRNERISVRYVDGKVLKDVKYKKIEQDLISGRCVLLS